MFERHLVQFIFDSGQIVELPRAYLLIQSADLLYICLNARLLTRCIRSSTTSPTRVRLVGITLLLVIVVDIFD